MKQIIKRTWHLLLVRLGIRKQGLDPMSIIGLPAYYWMLNKKMRRIGTVSGFDPKQGFRIDATVKNKAFMDKRVYAFDAKNNRSVLIYTPPHLK